MVQSFFIQTFVIIGLLIWLLIGGMPELVHNILSFWIRLLAGFSLFISIYIIARWYMDEDKFVEEQSKLNPELHSYPSVHKIAGAISLILLIAANYWGVAICYVILLWCIYEMRKCIETARKSTTIKDKKIT